MYQKLKKKPKLKYKHVFFYLEKYKRIIKSTLSLIQSVNIRVLHEGVRGDTDSMQRYWCHMKEEKREKKDLAKWESRDDDMVEK